MTSTTQKLVEKAADLLRGKITNAGARNASQVASELEIRRYASAILCRISAGRLLDTEAFSNERASYLLYKNDEVLVWWVNAWYPGRCMARRKDGRLHVHLLGYDTCYDRILLTDDRRVRRQILLKQREGKRILMGHFPRRGDFVRILRVDDFEAVHFQCRATAKDVSRTPVGIVLASLPLKDHAIVQVEGLICSEALRIPNADMMAISEKVYQDERNCLRDLRAKGLSLLEQRLCEGGQHRLLLTTAATISAQRCLVRFIDCGHFLQIRVLNPTLVRQLNLSYHGTDIHSLSPQQEAQQIPNEDQLPMPGTQVDTLSSDESSGMPVSWKGLSWQRKLGLCDGFLRLLEVRGGQLCLSQVLKRAQSGNGAPDTGEAPASAGPEDEQAYSEVASLCGELRSVDILVKILVTHSGVSDKSLLQIQVLHKVNGLIRRTYSFQPPNSTTLAHLGFPPLCWLRKDDLQALGRRILTTIDTFQGFPALRLGPQRILPTNFQTYPSCYPCQAFPTLCRVYLSSKAGGPGGTEGKPFAHNVCRAWRWIGRVRNQQDHSLDLPHLVNAQMTSLPCLISAKLAGTGHLEYSIQSSTSHTSRMRPPIPTILTAIINPHDYQQTGFQPLPWYLSHQEEDLGDRLAEASEATCRIVQLLADRLMIHKAELHFCPVLTYHYTLQYPYRRLAWLREASDQIVLRAEVCTIQMLGERPHSVHGGRITTTSSSALSDSTLLQNDCSSKTRSGNDTGSSSNSYGNSGTSSSSSSKRSRSASDVPNQRATFTSSKSTRSKSLDTSSPGSSRITSTSATTGSKSSGCAANISTNFSSSSSSSNKRSTSASDVHNSHAALGSLTSISSRSRDTFSQGSSSVTARSDTRSCNSSRTTSSNTSTTIDLSRTGARFSTSLFSSMTSSSRSSSSTFSSQASQCSHSSPSSTSHDSLFRRYTSVSPTTGSLPNAVWLPLELPDHSVKHEQSGQEGPASDRPDQRGEEISSKPTGSFNESSRPPYFPCLPQSPTPLTQPTLPLPSATQQCELHIKQPSSQRHVSPDPVIISPRLSATLDQQCLPEQQSNSPGSPAGSNESILLHMQVEDHLTHFKVSISSAPAETSNAAKASGIHGKAADNTVLVVDESNLMQLTDFPWTLTVPLNYLPPSTRTYLASRLTQRIHTHLTSLHSANPIQPISPSSQPARDRLPNVMPTPILLYQSIHRLRIPPPRWHRVLLVSLYDNGSGIQASLHDHTGTPITCPNLILSHESYQDILDGALAHSSSHMPPLPYPLPRPTYLLTLPSSALPPLLPILLPYLLPSLPSHFDSFITKRPCRSTPVPPLPHIDISIPDDILAAYHEHHIPKPSALKPRDIDYIKTLIHRADNLIMYINRRLDSEPAAQLAAPSRPGLSTSNTHMARASFTGLSKVPFGFWLCPCCNNHIAKERPPSTSLFVRRRRPCRKQIHWEVCSHERELCAMCIVRRKCRLAQAQNRALLRKMRQVLAKTRPPGKPVGTTQSIMVSKQEDCDKTHVALPDQLEAQSGGQVTASILQATSRDFSAGQQVSKQKGLARHSRPQIAEGAQADPRWFSKYNHYFLGPMLLDLPPSEPSTVTDCIEQEEIVCNSTVPHLAHEREPENCSDPVPTTELAIDSGTEKAQAGHEDGIGTLSQVLESAQDSALQTQEPINTASTVEEQLASNSSAAAGIQAADVVTQIEGRLAVSGAEGSTGDSRSVSEPTVDVHLQCRAIEVIEVECNACQRRIETDREHWLCCVDCEEFDLCHGCAGKQAFAVDKTIPELTARACGHVPVEHCLRWLG